MARISAVFPYDFYRFSLYYLIHPPALFSFPVDNNGEMWRPNNTHSLSSVTWLCRLSISCIVGSYCGCFLSVDVRIADSPRLSGCVTERRIEKKKLIWNWIMGTFQAVKLRFVVFSMARTLAVFPYNFYRFSLWLLSAAEKIFDCDMHFV